MPAKEQHTSMGKSPKADLEFLINPSLSIINIDLGPELLEWLIY